MKIYTDNIDVEMTIEEFENILDKGILDTMITIIASLSERMGAQKLKDPDEELTSLLNEILRDSAELDEDLEDVFGSICDKEECDDCGECDGLSEDDLSDEELDAIDEENETVNRIYYNIFRNGERYREE